MQLGGPSATEDFHLPSQSGAFRLNDLVVNRNEVFQGEVRLNGVAAEYPHIQVKNPVGSGITVLIDRLDIYVFEPGFLELCWYATDLTTDVGLLTARSPAGGNALAHIRTQTNGALLGTPWWSRYALANTASPLVWAFPLRLAPGEGFMLQQGVVNAMFIVSFELREI